MTFFWQQTVPSLSLIGRNNLAQSAGAARLAGYSLNLHLDTYSIVPIG